MLVSGMAGSRQKIIPSGLTLTPLTPFLSFFFSLLFSLLLFLYPSLCFGLCSGFLPSYRKHCSLT